MTDAQAYARTAQFPHILPETTAYYAGRAAADFGGKCEFTSPELRAAWSRGWRHMRSELRLDADTEWDND